MNKIFNLQLRKFYGSNFVATKNHFLNMKNIEDKAVDLYTYKNGFISQKTFPKMKFSDNNISEIFLTNNQKIFAHPSSKILTVSEDFCDIQKTMENNLPIKEFLFIKKRNYWKIIDQNEKISGNGVFIANIRRIYVRPNSFQPIYNFNMSNITLLSYLTKNIFSGIVVK